MGPWRSNARIPFCGLQHPETTPPSQKSTTSQTAPLEAQDHGEADEESLLRYIDGEKRPRVIRSLEEVPEDYLDFVCLGDNPDEYTVTESFDTQE